MWGHAPCFTSKENAVTNINKYFYPHTSSSHTTPKHFTHYPLQTLLLTNLNPIKSTPKPITHPNSNPKLYFQEKTHSSVLLIAEVNCQPGLALNQHLAIGFTTQCPALWFTAHLSLPPFPRLAAGLSSDSQVTSKSLMDAVGRSFAILLRGLTMHIT